MWRGTSALFVAALLLSGCNKGEQAEGHTEAAEAALGVPECDEYMKKMDAFLDSLPEDARAARAAGYKAMRSEWREVLKQPGGKDSLAATCKQHLATVK
jgi:hypothetical protein